VTTVHFMCAKDATSEVSCVSRMRQVRGLKGIKEIQRKDELMYFYLCQGFVSET
jgi:hypothetical protein